MAGAPDLRAPVPSLPAVVAVLLDRDGTLVVDMPHNADPDSVEPMPSARAAVDLLRADGLRLGVVTNQSVIGRGGATAAEVEATNQRVEDLLGPLGTFFVCPHAPWEACSCRKPAPGLVLDAAAALGVSPAQIVVIGDKGSDLAAAAAAGAVGILVPSHDTPSTDIGAATYVAETLLEAAQLVVTSRSAREE
jgi:histidinol-phosphate phosphatase family protein